MLTTVCHPPNPVSRHTQVALPSLESIGTACYNFFLPGPRMRAADLWGRGADGLAAAVSYRPRFVDTLGARVVAALEAGDEPLAEPHCFNCGTSKAAGYERYWCYGSTPKRWCDSCYNHYKNDYNLMLPFNAEAWRAPPHVRCGADGCTNCARPNREIGKAPQLRDHKWTHEKKQK